MPPNKTLDTIMADFLRYMVDLVYKHFRETMDVDEKTWEGVKNRITYILNYSNGWNTFQHFLMRNAAILAEIVPSSDEAKRRIKFVSEGEASLHWCIKNRVGLRKLSVGNQFIVVDAGGGTIDISSFKCVGTDHLEFEESSIPECHLQGSAFVTQAFREYVQAKLEGSSFGTPETIDRIVGNFEQQAMRTFKDRNEDMIVQFGRYQDNDPGFGINAGQLLVPGKEMAQCFELACNAIVASVKAKVVPDCKAILVLVGGFSRNEYLFKEVRSRLHELDIQMFRPIEAKVKPSAHGALCFYLDPAVRSSNMQPADGSDTLVSESDMGSSDPASVGPRPCERNSKGLQHLNYWRSPYKGTENNLAVSIDLGTTFSGTSWVFLEPGQIPQTIWDVPP
ncbi:hypothetical protein FRC03_007230 [Tulasnella sp. 419]|nr:hypothetical protein FRC03_007230 [Tulasnella sp. 419]